MQDNRSGRLRERLKGGILSALRQGRETRPSSVCGMPTDTHTLIASYNVHKCVGMDQRFDPDRTASVIGEIAADILALQEAYQRFGSRAPLLDFPRLEREHGLVAVPVAGPRGQGWHGNALLVRKGMVRDVHQILLPGVEPRGALVVDVDLDAGPLRIVAAHLGLLRQSRAQQARAILSAISARPEMPTLLMGDLNEWRVGPRSALLHFEPAFGPLAAGLPSFPSRFPLFALDRILGSPHDLVSRVEVHATPLARIASDHLPVKAWIARAAVSTEAVGAEGLVAA